MKESGHVSFGQKGEKNRSALAISRVIFIPDVMAIVNESVDKDGKKGKYKIQYKRKCC